MSGGQPEIVDNGGRYGHAEALGWLAEQYPQLLRVATGYVNLPGLGGSGGTERAGPTVTAVAGGGARTRAGRSAHDRGGAGGRQGLRCDTAPAR